MKKFTTLGQHICVLEDDADIRELISYLLESEGFKVTAFSCVTDFKAEPFAEDIALFLLDVMLPDGNGIVVCQELKSAEATAHIPVLLMSANAPAALQGACKNDGFISKPFDIDDLVARVRQMLD